LVLESTMNAILSPLLSLHPALTIFIVALVISIVTTFVNKKTMNSEKGKVAKEKLEKANKLRDDVLKAQKEGDKKKAEQLSKRVLELQSKYFSEYSSLSFKPMLISIFLVILFLPWMKSTYGSQIVATVPAVIPYIGGNGMSWLWWYFICALSLSIVVRKIMGE